MEGGAAAAAAAAAAEGKHKEETAASYTYWVREKTSDAAPLPVPRKLNPSDQPNNQTPTHLGSAWNRVGFPHPCHVFSLLLDCLSHFAFIDF